jgi:phenylalanyl-tRNA synthetase alpha chain
MADNDILKELEQIQRTALEALQGAQDEAGLQAWRTAHIGRSSAVMQVFSNLPQFSKELRPQIGQQANRVKQALEAAFEEASSKIKAAALQRSLAQERLDVTLPGRTPVSGRLHIQTEMTRRVVGIFNEMGFQVFRSRDVENDEYNFELLNIPAFHPARDMWSTYHTTNPGVILRTHTSPGQIHAMRAYAPEPIRVILPGMCYRFEQMDARHENQFNQLEVLAVGEGITFGDLKGTLLDFARRLYGENTRIRFRPSYFPFTEPSAEVDIECFICGGKGCPVCSNGGWLEVGGCGMVHPTVLKNGGYDPEKFTGFAAGMGIERISMLFHRIEDIRYFWQNDIRFLEQF